MGKGPVSRLVSDLSKPTKIMSFYQSSLSENILLRRLHEALLCGKFEDDDGNIEVLDEAGISMSEVALLHFLLNTLKPRVTVETGFGLGVSALAFLASTSGYEHERHICIDPGGIPSRGRTILNHISKTTQRFELIKDRSEYTLPRLITNGDLTDCSVSLIDGSHLFEIALADFMFLDRATRKAGCIVVDDAPYPAIEAIINFVAANRDNYRIVEFSDNCVVLVKSGQHDVRQWDHFRPFSVPRRSDWTPSLRSRMRRLGSRLRGSQGILPMRAEI